MKKLLFFLLSTAAIFQTFALENGYVKCPGKTQKTDLDFSNLIRFERNISLEDAFRIADGDRRIDYFTYVTAPEWKAFLFQGNPRFVRWSWNDPYRLIRCDYAEDHGQVDVHYRLLKAKDALFFNKEGRWLTPSNGEADTYCKLDPESDPRFEKIPNRFQSARSDFKNVVRCERYISLEKAFEIAAADPQIGYFCYVSGTLRLPIPSDIPFDPSRDDRFNLVSFIYHRGQIGWGFQREFEIYNAIFFRADGMDLAEADGRADAYVKSSSEDRTQGD